MATDPRAALDALVAAFYAHLDAATAADDPESDAVLDAAGELADAFDAYDDALYDVTGVDTPLYVDEDDEDEDDEDEPDEDEDDDEDEPDEDDDEDDEDEDEEGDETDDDGGADVER